MPRHRFVQAVFFFERLMEMVRTENAIWWTIHLLWENVLSQEKEGIKINYVWWKNKCIPCNHIFKIDPGTISQQHTFCINCLQYFLTLCKALVLFLLFSVLFVRITCFFLFIWLIQFQNIASYFDDHKLWFISLYKPKHIIHNNVHNFAFESKLANRSRIFIYDGINQWRVSSQADRVWWCVLMICMSFMRKLSTKNYDFEM